jgi:phage-related protein
MSIKQDRNGVRTAQDLERKYDLASLVGIKKAVRQSEEGLTKTNAELENFMTATLNTMADLESRIDGNVNTYFYSGIPTLDNMPASEWTTDTERNTHLGDLYYDEDTGYAYRFALCSGVYKWLELADSDVAEALALANLAKDTADGKRRVFVTTPFVPYDEGDLWLYNNELYVCITPKTETQSYDANDFKKAVKYTDDTALNSFVAGEYADDIQAINSQIDKKAETWYQATDPSTTWVTVADKEGHVGDLWYNTSENKSYIYTSSNTWQEADGVPDSVYDRIDGKAQIFTSQPTPPYYVGDLYTQGTAGDILVCKTERLTGSYTASDWQKAGKYTDDTNLNNFVNVTYTKQVNELNSKIDTKITTWYYSGVPTLSNSPAKDWTTNDLKTSHVGDLYYDKATGYTYRFNYENNVYAWGQIIDSDLTEALALANSASDTADSKRRIFTAQPTPPYDNGDLWFNNQEIYICQISKGEAETYANNDFIIATKYTDDTLATQVGDNLEVVRGTVTTIKESVDAFKIDIETTVKSIDDLQQETIESFERMSYTFGTKDLTIANSNDPVNARINNQGLKVYTYNTLNSIFNHKGTGIQKLIVVGDSQLANVSIVKTTDENGEPCTDINHLVSNIQDLSDLEV